MRYGVEKSGEGFVFFVEGYVMFVESFGVFVET